MMHFLGLVAVSAALHLGHHQSAHHHAFFAHQHQAHRLRHARTSQHEDADCSQFQTPCDCTVEGCGWSTIRSQCEAGGQTDCLECPNILLCGDETCMMQMLDDDDVVEAQRKGKECVEDGNDMGDCLCDDDIGGVMESKLSASGCCEANELFWQMCYNRKCEAPAVGQCAGIVEPCECGTVAGCGWDSDAKSCVEGGLTDCKECPHSMLCHSGDTHDVCSVALFKNPDVLEAINKAKVCMQSERDGMEHCLRHSSHKLKKLIEEVEWNGETLNCCNDNKFFSMVCEGPVASTTTTTAAPAEPEATEAPEEPEEEPEEEEEEETTTTTTTTELDLMAEIERLAREYGLVTTTPAPGSSGADGEGGDGADGADGAEADGAEAGGDDADGSDDADSAADGSDESNALVTGGSTSGSLDQSAKNTADQVAASGEARAPEEDPTPARKTPPEDQETAE